MEDVELVDGRTAQQSVGRPAGTKTASIHVARMTDKAHCLAAGMPARTVMATVLGPVGLSDVLEVVARTARPASTLKTFPAASPLG